LEEHVRYELRSIGIWALIKVSFFLNLIFGFIFGIFYALILLPLTRLVTQLSEVESLQYESDATMGLLFLLPFLFALFAAFINTLFAALIGALYNGIVRITGGLEFNFEKIPKMEFLNVQPVSQQSVVSSNLESPQPSRPEPPRPYRSQSVPPTSVAPDQTAPDESEIDRLQVDREPESPVVEPHVEPDEDGPRQDNP
jgi:hypothetical protein